jgi:hypothetical protein
MPVGQLVCVIYILPFSFSLGPPLSHPLCQNAPMKINLLTWLKRDEGETMATFGEARLVKKLNGKFELRGGTAADRTEAKEWCSLFLHNAVFSSSPPQVHHAATRHLQPQRA